MGSAVNEQIKTKKAALEPGGPTTHNNAASVDAPIDSQRLERQSCAMSMNSIFIGAVFLL